MSKHDMISHPLIYRGEDAMGEEPEISIPYVKYMIEEYVFGEYYDDVHSVWIGNVYQFSETPAHEVVSAIEEIIKEAFANPASSFYCTISTSDDIVIVKEALAFAINRLKDPLPF